MKNNGKIYWAVKRTDFELGKYYENPIELKKEHPEIGFLSQVFCASYTEDENGKKKWSNTMCVALA